MVEKGNRVNKPRPRERNVIGQSRRWVNRSDTNAKDCWRTSSLWTGSGEGKGPVHRLGNILCGELLSFTEAVKVETILKRVSLRTVQELHMYKESVLVCGELVFSIDVESGYFGNGWVDELYKNCYCIRVVFFPQKQNGKGRLRTLCEEI